MTTFTRICVVIGSGTFIPENPTNFGIYVMKKNMIADTTTAERGKIRRQRLHLGKPLEWSRLRRRTSTNAPLDRLPSPRSIQMEKIMAVSP